MDNNTVIFYSRFFQPLNEPQFSSYLGLLPAWKKQRIKKFRRWEDAQASLFGNLLLLEGLKYLGRAHTRLDDIQLSPYNRPFLATGPDFNISHSGQFVVCALSTSGRIGIDVEYMAPLDMQEFGFLFTPTEWTDIHLSSIPLARFYDYWTRKEAVVKADGKGLNIDITTIRIRDGQAHMDDAEWHLNEIRLHEHYKTCVASDYKVGDMILKEICF